jgi:hypothetical protein
MGATVGGGTKRRTSKRAALASTVAVVAVASMSALSPAVAIGSRPRGAAAPGSSITAGSAAARAGRAAQPNQTPQQTSQGAVPTSQTPQQTSQGAGPTSQTPQQTGQTSQGAGPTAAPTRAASSQWGLYAPDFPGTLATVDAVQSAVGRRADYVMWYVHWAGPYSQLNLSDLAAVAGNGSTPEITWMSDDPTGATTITDTAVASGRYDSYIRSWAEGLRSFGRPVLLRFDHEMNGNWYGWSPGVNGNTAAGYIAAWRHVHGIFAAVGATNVTFVWSPNVSYSGSTPLASVYPGDGYVGMVALDGYNWGPLDGHVWQTPEEVFGPSVAEITAVTHRPLMIGEVGSTEVGGDKAAWIGQFFDLLRSTPAIRGFVWFDADKETDWRLNSSPQTLAAFEAGLTG